VFNILEQATVLNKQEGLIPPEKSHPWIDLYRSIGHSPYEPSFLPSEAI